MGLRACKKCFPGGEPKDGSGKKKKSKHHKIKLNKTSIVLLKGKTAKLKVKNATGKISWKSSKRSVASVNSKGVVKGKSVGTAYISAKANKQTKKCKVKVEDPRFANNQLEVNIDEESFYLNILGCKHDAKWYSSNDDIIYVDDDGELLLLDVGTATITAKVHGKTLKCKITVISSDNGNDDDDDYYDDYYDD